MLYHLVRVDHVECAVLEGQPLVEIRATDVDAQAARDLGVLLEEFDAAQISRDTTRIQTGREIGVRLLYWTAFVDGQGRVAFREDIYKRDQKLAEALGIAISLPTAIDDGAAVANDVGP